VSLVIGIFVCGTLVLFLSNNAFSPLEQNAVTLGLVVIWFAGASVLTWAKKNDDGDDSDSYWPRKRYLAIGFLPWVLSAVISANAILDSSEALPHRAVVVDRSRGRYSSSLKVQSWRSSHGTESISVNRACYEASTVGAQIIVTEKNGALGIHWITAVSGCSR